MSKPEIISKFLESGLLLSPDVLERIDANNFETLLNTAKSRNEIIITKIEEPQISASIRQFSQKSTLTPKDFVEYYSKKYEKLGQILSQKIQPISINRLSGGQESIIGMVLELTNNGYIVEDPTGKIEIRTDKQLQLNSVYGFKGSAKENIFFATDVIFPDLPLTRKIQKIDAEILLTTGKSSQNKFAITTNTEFSGADFVHCKANPCHLILFSGENKLTIVVFRPEESITQKKATQFLKNRFIDEPKIPDESFILDMEIDVFWIIQKTNWSENYKGTTIVSGEDIFLNLKTRSVYSPDKNSP